LYNSQLSTCNSSTFRVVAEVSRGGVASRNYQWLDGKAKPFRTSDGKAAIEQGTACRAPTLNNPVATAPGSDTATLTDYSTFCAKLFGKSAISNPKPEIRPLWLRKITLFYR
jgi:hypothetical protein